VSPVSPAQPSRRPNARWLLALGLCLAGGGCGESPRARPVADAGGETRDGGGLADLGPGPADLHPDAGRPRVDLGRADLGPLDSGPRDQGAGDLAPADLADLPADGGELPPERSCLSTFRFRPERPARRVRVAGEWGWEDPARWVTLRDDDGDGVFTGEERFPPGLYAYKLVVEYPDGTEDWLLDPDNGYRQYSGDTENSGLRVPDCRQPLLQLVSFRTLPVVGGRGGVEAEVRFLRGTGGAGPSPEVTRVRLRHEGRDTLLAPPAAELHAGGRLPIRLGELAPGKYTLLVAGGDTQGQSAAPLQLPFWIEREPFDWRDGPIYLAMIDRFRRGPQPDPSPTPGATGTADWYGGDLAGLLAALREGWFEKLGVGALWLTPFNTNPAGVYPGDGGHGVTGYHGYWPIAARDLDPRYGSPEQLRELVHEAHRRGLRVLMDLVLNHVHEDHEYRRDHPDWYRDGCLCGTEGCGWNAHRLDCLFARYLPDVDWRVTAASEQLIDDALWWLAEYDLDGFRVDAVKHVEDLAVRNLAIRIREEFEGAGTRYFLLGETAMGWNTTCETVECNREEYDTISRYIGPDGLDGQLDFVLFHATAYRVFARGERGFIHLDFWTLASQEQFPAGSIMAPYVGSHDTSRLLSVAHYRGQDADHPVSRVGSCWPEQELPQPPQDLEPYQRARLALTWLLAMPGAPLLYYGDEYGEHGGCDPDNRHLGRTDAEASLLPQQRDLLLAVRAAGQARRSSLALRRGRYTSVRGEEDLLVFARHTEDQAALVLLNRAPVAARRDLELPPAVPLADGPLRDLLDPAGTSVTVAGGRLTVDLPAWGARILVPAE